MTKFTNLIRPHIWIFFLLFLAVDYIQSNYHYSNLPIDGDLCRVAGPFKWYEDVLNDPIGIQAITENKKYGGAARYVCHKSTSWWFEHIPIAIQSVVKDKVHSIYYASALSVAIIHLCFVWLAFQYAKAKEQFSFKRFIPIALLASILIQYNSYYGSIGLIDRSINYTFFYILPIIVLLIYFLPFFKYEQFDTYKITIGHQILLLFLAPILAFSGPLIQPVVFLVSLFYLFGVFIRNPFYSIKKNKKLIFHLCLFLLICIYAFYVSKFNSESSIYKPLLERYYLLLKGFYRIMTNSPAWLFIFLLTALNIYLIRIYKLMSWKKLRSIGFFVLGLCALYILLLPFGGYRAYREVIIRYDTFIPVTLGLSFLLLFTTYKVFYRIKKERWLPYCLVILLFSGIFFLADKNTEQEANYCQQGHLYEIQKSEEEIIRRPFTCNIMTWSKNDIYDIEHVKGINIMLRKWKLINSNQRVEFYEGE